MRNIRLIDSLPEGRLSNLNIDGNALRNRLQRAVDEVAAGAFTVGAIERGWPTQADVSSLQSGTGILVVLIGPKTDKGNVVTLATSMHAKRDRLAVQVGQMVDGAEGTAGLTVKNLCFVSTSRADLVGAESSNQNSIFVGNVLVHEVGHALLDTWNADADHQTGAVMKATIETGEGPLTYSASFRSAVAGKAGHAR